MHMRVSSTQIAAILVVWGSTVAALATFGFLMLLAPRAVAGVVALGIVVPTLVYFWFAPLRDWVERFGLRRLTLFHSWRIAAAILFFAYGAAGKLPDLFVRNAAWGDLIAGLAAVVVVALPLSRWRYFAMHLFGMADFFTAVGTGLYFTLTDAPSMVEIRMLPVALIPMFGVGLSGATHIMAFDLLRRRVGGLR